MLFALWPTTFFFRMTYSESTFLFCTLLTLLGMQRRWPLVVIGLLAGLATAARPVGVALLLPLCYHVGQRSDAGRLFVRRMVYLAPLACCGLLAYMAYQYIAFDDALAFAKTQEHWRRRELGSFSEKAWALATLEPLWSVYVDSSPAYWRNFSRMEHAIFSLEFANQIVFVLAIVLVAIGAWRRWLSWEEILLAAGLLFIPYVTRAHEMCMASQGRFAAVVFPMYIVLGHVLARLPISISGGLYGLCAFYLAVYAAFFAAGYALI